MNTPTALSPARATPREWAGLGVLALALLLLAVDATVLDLAVPAISADLAPSTRSCSGSSTCTRSCSPACWW